MRIKIKTAHLITGLYYLVSFNKDPMIYTKDAMKIILKNSPKF